MTLGDAQALVGVWKLVSWEVRQVDGTVARPYGSQPVGLVIYEPTGYMSAQIMRSDDGVTPAPTTSQRARALGRHYLAYYGRYEVDEAAGVVTHHVEASANPAWVGGDQVRRFELDGDWLVLQPPATRGGQGTLRWERVGGLTDRVAS